MDELVDAETAEHIRSRQQSEPVRHPVLPEHWAAFETFIACATQWRYAPLGGAIGLDYSGLKAVMDMHQVPMNERKELMDQVQWIERGALEVMNRKKRR